MPNSVQVENLTKIFKAKVSGKNGITALDNVTLAIEKGTIFGLLGPNGAGKTTLIKILLGLVFPTSGSAKILDTDISDFNIRKKIGYLPENHKFPNYLTGEDVIVYYSKLSGFEIDKKSPKITEVLNLVKMEKWRKTKIKKYSKGMMQRLGLAQAIIHDPEIIFLDEPTDGVDPIGRKEIRDLLISLKNQGKTIFINSHLLSEVELVTDKVAILNEGKLIKFGTVDELTVNKQLYEIKTDLPISTELFRSLIENYKITQKENMISLEISDNSDLNKFLDELRKSSINIIGVNQKKSSLEDTFIQSLTEVKN
ncbi:MAG: ABC transporter ATP-binding protein [Ignavibacteriae bacterium]|nr:ABC transporter ATP-binding protein [Ignavibacteriota bacterium]MCB9217999.1 ABC transporter ATP-binding protein [Ignavibacteriales bacterium]MCB9260388.1 ABC transporter ATP-binding protein [Ignavibacteriales bacterium]